MRPPEFTGGNDMKILAFEIEERSFNEAAGIHRRKQSLCVLSIAKCYSASMRPPEFTGGNSRSVSSPFT